MAHAPIWLIRRVGRRGYILLNIAMLSAVHGWALAYPATPQRAASNTFIVGSFLGADSHVLLLMWAGLWWVAAGLCLVCAFLRSDWPGYGSAVLVQVAWAAANLIAATRGLSDGVTRSVTWVFIASVILAISTMQENRPTVADLTRRRRTPVHSDALTLVAAAADVVEVAERLSGGDGDGVPDE